MGRAMTDERTLTDQMRRLANAAVIAAFVLVGLYSLYLAAFHAWATALPKAQTEWHRLWAERFLLIAGVSFVLALAWATRRRWWRR